MVSRMVVFTGQCKYRLLKLIGTHQPDKLQSARKTCANTCSNLFVATKAWPSETIHIYIYAYRKSYVVLTINNVPLILKEKEVILFMGRTYNRSFREIFQGGPRPFDPLNCS